MMNTSKTGDRFQIGEFLVGSFLLAPILDRPFLSFGCCRMCQLQRPPSRKGLEVIFLGRVDIRGQPR